MTSSDIQWWLELADDEWRENFTSCVSCGTPADSVDVVCTKDDTVLLDSGTPLRLITASAYVLRGLVVLAALAVGYLRWTWPAYVVGAILALAFAFLFVRNHRAASMYLVAVGCSVAAAHGIWAGLNYPHLRDIVWFVILAALVAEEGGTFPELHVAGHTVAVVSISILVMCGGVIALVAERMKTDLAPAWLIWAASHLTPIAISVALFAILVSGVAFTLTAPAFTVDDIFHFRKVLRPVRLSRIRTPDYSKVHGALERVAATMERIAIGFANGITGAIETAYNHQFCAIINGMVRAAVRVGNAMHRWLVKAARHIARVLERCFQLARKCGWWCWFVTKRFTAAFASTVILSWFACYELWWIAEEIRGYVLHERIWATPLLSLGRTALVILPLTVATMLMLQVSPGNAISKLAAASGAVGGRAFLFFVFIAWTLGLVGWATDGPFRIGWVTLTSTGIVVAALVALRARRPTAVVAT